MTRIHSRLCGKPQSKNSFNNRHDRSCHCHPWKMDFESELGIPAVHTVTFGIYVKVIPALSLGAFISAMALTFSGSR